MILFAKVLKQRLVFCLWTKNLAEAEISLKQFIGFVQDEMHHIQHKPNLLEHQILFTEAQQVILECDKFASKFSNRNHYFDEKPADVKIISQKITQLFQPHSYWVSKEVLEKNTLLINHFFNFHYAFSKEASAKFGEEGNQQHFLEIQKVLLDAMKVFFAKEPPKAIDQVTG